MPTDQLTLATCANHRFFGACLTLIESAQRTSTPLLKEILVYDLGLKGWQKWALEQLDLVTVVAFPEHLKDIYPDFMNPIQFAWKPYLWTDLHTRCDYAVYLDSGVEILQSLEPVLQILKEQDIFLIEDLDWKVSEFTHQACVEIMKATEAELGAYMLHAGISGFKTNGKYREVFDEAYKYAQIPECIRGPRAKGPNQHRHDQSILSILSVRYDCPRQLLETYGQWNWERAKQTPDCVLHVHRKRKGIRKARPLIKPTTSGVSKCALSLLFKAVSCSRNKECRTRYKL